MLHNAWRIITDCSGPSDPNPDGIDVWDSRYNCGCNFDLAAAVYDSITLDISGQETLPTGMTFGDSGTKLYILGGINDTIFQYTLTTAYDLSTASYASIFLDVTSEDAGAQGVIFNTDGTKMYYLGGISDTIFQYTLSTAWDVSTAVYDTVSFSVTTEDTSPNSLHLSTDGTKLFVLGSSSDTVFQYTLSTSWDISSASYDTVSLDITSEISTSSGVEFNAGGTRMYITGTAAEGGDNVFQYTLTTAWDLSTATYDSVSLDTSAEDSFTQKALFSPDCTKMYLIGYGTDAVYQYS